MRVSVTASDVTPLSEVTALLRSAHANLLLVGAEAAVVDILDGLRPHCRQPVETCETGSFTALSPPPQAGTLILRDVGNLTQEGQRRLMEWLDGNARNRVQLIATNASALWPRVRDGSFADALYYRLNAIYIDLTDGAAIQYATAPSRSRGSTDVAANLAVPPEPTTANSLDRGSGKKSRGLRPLGHLTANAKCT